MKRKKVLIMMFIMYVMFAGAFVSADASEYTVNDISGLHYFDSYDLINVEGNKMYIVNTDYDYEPNDDEKYYHKMVWKSISKDGNVKTSEFVCDRKTYVQGVENNNIYTSKYTLKSNKLVIHVRNKKGKIKATYKITEKNKVTKKLKNLGISSITLKGNKMYYVISGINKKNKWYYYLQCYNMKKKKVVSSKRMSRRGYVDDDNFYICEAEKKIITKFNLKGEKVVSFAFPEGETSVTINYLNGFSHTQENGLQSYDVNGRYIYYCNRNGLYRCDTEGDGIFELIYDGSNDREVFNPAMYEEKILMKFCVLEDESFCIATCDQNGTPGRRYMYKKQ